MLTKLFNDFFNSEKAGGLILIFATALSLTLANTNIGEGYISVWHHNIAGHSITHWINDGLMALFFLLIGLELEREIYLGELSSIKQAAFPAIGALGGMMLPAAIFLVFNYGTPTQAGAGIPMATDIAFAVGILSLLGNRVPASLKIFLMALAVIDDLGAIVVIAIFYTKTILLVNLMTALGIFVVLLMLNRLKVRNLIPYLLGGIAMWYFMLHSGIHATIAGVLLGFAIPFGNGDERSTSYILQHYLHKPVAFIILPLFALANTSILLTDNLVGNLTTPNSVGILTGLVLGKPLGIFLFTLAGTLAGICTLPDDLNWRQIISVAFLGGIGFTMSIFITILAFDHEAIISSSKIAILVASLVAAFVGYALLKFNLKNIQEG